MLYLVKYLMGKQRVCPNVCKKTYCVNVFYTFILLYPSPEGPAVSRELSR